MMAEAERLESDAIHLIDTEIARLGVYGHTS